MPEIAERSSADWDAMQQVIEAQLAQRPAALQRQLVTFVRAIEYLPLVWRQGRFTRLSLGERVRVLERLEVSRFLLVRRGVWGLRTLVFMAFYTQPAMQQAIGYRAHRDGWNIRRQPTEPRPPGVPPITLEMPVPESPTNP